MSITIKYSINLVKYQPDSQTVELSQFRNKNVQDISNRSNINNFASRIKIVEISRTLLAFFLFFATIKYARYLTKAK